MTRPTHRIIADGSLVFPQGYDPADIEELPGAYWDEADFVAARLARKNETRRLRDLAEAGGCTVPGIGRFDTDPDSQRKIAGATLAASIAGGAFTMDWRLSDNSIQTLDQAAMVAVGLTVAQHVAACQYRKNELDALLNAATTIEELEAVDIASGWPS